jgi:hypothetical protein
MYIKEFIDAGFNFEIEGENLTVQPASKLTTVQLQFIRQHKAEILDELRQSPDCVDGFGGRGNSNLKETNILNPKTRKIPQLSLLTEVELEAFNGWYATMRKPKFGMSHEDAELLAWKYLMESMEIMFKEKRGRYE